MLAQVVGEGDFDLLLCELGFELQQELVHHAQDDLLIQRLEADDGVQPVAEFGREQALDVAHFIARLTRVGEADGGLVHGLGARVRRHDDDDVAEVGLAPVVVRQRAVVHDLQQHVEDVRVRLLDFVEQQHGVRLLGDGLGQQAALVEADIARGRANQAADGVALHVLRHVEADQVHAHDVGQLFGGLGLAHARGAAEQEGADGLVALAQARACHLDAGRQHFQGLVLAEHHALEVALQRLQLAAVVVAHVRGRDARDLRDDFLDLGLADGLLALGRREDALRRTRFVDHIDGLVGQVAVVDVLGAQLGSGLQRGGGVLHAVVLLKARLQPLEDLDGLGHRGLDHVHLLEAARQRSVFLEDAAVLGERGGTDALELPRRQRRLEQVARVQRAARCGARTDQGVDLVDEQDGMRLVLEALEHALEALLEVAAVLGAGQQRPHVKRVDVGLQQHLGHGALGNAPGQALGDGRLAHTGLAHQQRVVLATAAQDLDGALNLVVAPDQRVDLAVLGGLVEVLRVLLQRRRLLAAALALRAAVLAIALALGFGRLGGLALLDAVGDEIDHIQARNALLVQVVHGVRVFLAENGHEHVGARDFLLAVASGLHVHDGALDDALEAQRGLGVDLVGTRHLGRVVLDEVGQRCAQVVDLRGAGAQHLGCARVIEQCKQQMLHGNELVALLTGLNKGHVQADFQFLGNHVRTPLCLRWDDFISGPKAFYSTGSLTACSGCPAWWAAASTCSTLVAATSREYTPQTPLPSR